MADGELTAYLDEHLDDPDAADVAGGIPDPVLAEIGATRTGAMREIVATIQAEQDIVIRAPIDQVLVVQGGPGTGKTAVALHRAAYLMFEHRRRLAREGVLVDRPEPGLPGLHRQCAAVAGRAQRASVHGAGSVCAEGRGHGSRRVDDARRKGHRRCSVRSSAAALAAVTPPTEDVVVPLGARRVVFGVDEVTEWLERAKDSVIPVNQRRERLRAIARQALLRRTGEDEHWPKAGALRTALAKAWPTQQPIKLVDKLLPGPSGKRRQWTAADQFLVDEANSILNGPPAVYGHVVVDEAQDHSAVALARDRPAHARRHR